MAPHEQAEEFVSSYRKLMKDDTDVNNFQRILEMKVCSASTHHVYSETSQQPDSQEQPDSLQRPH